MEMEDNTLGPMIAEIAEPPILIPCTICGRTFKSESLRKHQGVCQKNATKKRRVFDSMKQRIQGTELAEYIPIPVVPPKPKLIAVNKATVAKSLSNRPANDFPHATHNVHTPNTERSRGAAAVRSNSISSTTPSRSGAAHKEELCPHCDRTFGWKAFSRHEEWCREHKTRLAQAQSPAAVMKAKEMLDARIKYRAPLVGKLKRPTNRQKYAGGVIGAPTVSHSLPKSTVTDVHLQNILSPKTSTPSYNRESRKKSTPKTSTVSTPSAIVAHQPDMRKTSATIKRDVSPLKEIPHIINPPWDLNIANEEGMDAKESTSSSRNRATPQENNDEYVHHEAYHKQYSRELENKENNKEESLEQMIKNVKNILKDISKNSPKHSTEIKGTKHNGERSSGNLKYEEGSIESTHSPKYSKEKKEISANVHKHFDNNVSQSKSFKKTADENGIHLKNNVSSAHKLHSADPDVHFTSEDNLDYSPKLSVDPTENMLNTLGQGDGDFADIIYEKMQRTFVFRIFDSSDDSDDNIDQFTEDRFEEISDNIQDEPGDHKEILKTPEFHGKKIKNDENKTNLVNITEKSYSRPNSNSIEEVSRKSCSNLQEVAKNESGVLSNNIKLVDSSKPQKNVNRFAPSMPKLNDCSVNSESIFVSKITMEKGSNLVTWKEISMPNANKEDNREKKECRIDDDTFGQTFTSVCDKRLAEENKQKVDDEQMTQTCPSENEQNKAVHISKKIFHAANEKVCKSDNSQGFSDVSKKNKGTDHKKSKLPVPVPKTPKPYLISFQDDSSFKKDLSFDDSSFKKDLSINSDKQDSFHMDSKTKCFCKNLNSTFILSDTLEEKAAKCLYDSNLTNTEKGSYGTSSNETSPVRQKGIIRKCKPDEFEHVTWMEMCANKGGVPGKYCLNDNMQSECFDDNNVVISGMNDNIFCNCTKGEIDNSTEKLPNEVNDGITASPTQEILHEVKMWSYGAFTNTNGYWDRRDNYYPTTDFPKLEDYEDNEVLNTSTCDVKENHEDVTNSSNYNNNFGDGVGAVSQINYPKQFCFDPIKIKGKDDNGFIGSKLEKNNPNSCLFQGKSAPLSLEDLTTTPSKNNNVHDEEEKNDNSDGNKTYLISKNIRKVNDNVDLKATYNQETQSDYVNIYSSQRKKHQSTCKFLKPNTTGTTKQDENVTNSIKKLSSPKNRDDIDSNNRGTITKGASFPKKIHCESESVSLKTQKISNQDKMKKMHAALESDVSKDFGGLCITRSQKDGDDNCLSGKHSASPQSKDNKNKCVHDTSSNHTDISNKTITLEDRDLRKFLKETNSSLNKNLGAEKSLVNNAKIKDITGEEIQHESSAVTIRETTSSRTYDVCSAASSSEGLNYAQLSENSSSSFISMSSSNPYSSCSTCPPDLSSRNSPNLITVLKKYNIALNQINGKADMDSDDISRITSTPPDQKFQSNIFSKHNSFQQSPKYNPNSDREHNESSTLQKNSTETGSQKDTSLNTNKGSDKTVIPLTQKKVMIEEEYDSDKTHQTHLPIINNNVISSQIEWLNLVQTFDKSYSDHIPTLKEAREMDSNKLPNNESYIFDFKRKESNIRKRLFREVKSLESTPRKLPRNLEASNVWKSDYLKEEAGDCNQQFSVHGRMLAENRIKKRLQIRQTNETLKKVVGDISPDLSNCTLTLHCKHPTKKNSVSPSSKQLPPMKPVSCKLFKGTSPECTNKSSEDDKGGGQSPVEKPSYRLSTYDPYSKAEMQLRELLSDGGSIQNPKIMQSTPVKDSRENQILEPTLQTHHVASKNNGNLDVHNIYANQKQAKEDILPDMFTETSTQLNFEMPNFMRGREETLMTKRRAMKPTAQNMGIELNPVARENILLRRDYVTNDIEIKSKELFTELENKVSGNSNLVKGMAKSEAGDQIDIESIHQSINLVALGLSNLSTNSQKSLIDVDNNNAVSGGKSIKERADNVEYSGNLSEMDKRIALTSHSTRPTSSGDGESEGDGKRIRRRKRRGKSEQGDEVREDVSSPDSLVTFQPRVSAKPSVDSAYSSLNRPSFRAIEDAKKAINKAFDPHNQQTSSGEDDHADEWSEDDVPKNESSRWNTKQNVIEPSTDFKMAKFCHECGSRYPLTEAKFCCVCGVRRLTV